MIVKYDGREMTDDEFTAWLLTAAKKAQKELERFPKPIASICISKEGQAVEVSLDTSKGTYSEWIEGEGADIGLDRDMETKKVNGVRLPLYAKTIIIGGVGLNMPTIYIDIETGRVEIKNESRE